MACSTKHGPATAIKFFEAATGRKLTQDDWHLIREDTEEADGKLRRTRADEGDAANAFMHFADIVNRDERVPAHEVEAACVEFVNAGNTVGTLAMLRRIAENGLPASVTDRKRRGDGKPRSKKADTGDVKNGVNNCPACGEFANDTHTCSPEKLREYAVAEDTHSAKLYDERWLANEQRLAMADALHRMNGEKRDYYGNYVNDINTTIEELEAKVRHAEDNGEAFLGSAYLRDVKGQLVSFDEQAVRLGELNDQLQEANERYKRFGWDRAFLVVTNGTGHVHKSMYCSTCYPTTRFHWLPSYSGSTENQIVGDAGERACTVCYPSAPVDVLARPTKIYSEDEKRKADEREQRKAEKVRKDADKAAKAPTKTGEPLRVVTDRVPSRRNPGEMVDRFEEFKTERAATTWAVDRMWWAEYRAENGSAGYGSDGFDDFERDAIGNIVTALAEKRGVDESEIRAELDKKLVAKKKRDR